MSDLNIRIWRNAATDLRLADGIDTLDAQQARRPLEVARTRLLVAAAIFTLCFVILGGRLVQLSVFGVEQQEKQIVANETNALTLKRADIVDRNGTLIATNLPAQSLFVNPEEVLDVEEAVAKIVEILPNIPRKTINRIASAKGQFAWIKRFLTPDEHKRINQLGLPGFYFQREERRAYPHGSLYAHALGFAGDDNDGLAGLEMARDSTLKMLANSPNAKLITALDGRVQHAVHDELSKAMKIFNAKGAAGIVLNVHNGEVLSLVSLPDFDPYNYNSEKFINRATYGVYELGSTFKPFTTAMALEAGVVDIDDRYDATKPLKVGRHSIRDVHPQNRWLSIPEILIHSSNIGAAQIARDVGAERQRKFFKNLGMLDPLTLELIENGHPRVPNNWREIRTMTIGYGYGLSVTPMHLINGFASLVNGGLKIKPTLLRHKQTNNLERVISKKTSDMMRRMMRLVVEEGTGKKANARGYAVGGKTGTAWRAAAGGYDSNKLITTFIGAFPITEPQFAILVMLEEPNSTKETHGYAGAGWNAAPVLGKIVSRIAPIMGVIPYLPPTNNKKVKTKPVLVKASLEERQFASY